MMFARIEELLQNNEAFVAEQLRQDANYFDKLADGQHPEFLWIGCSDSRVPPDRITGTTPGTCSSIATSRTWWCRRT